jgi:hypothetical protein
MLRITIELVPFGHESRAHRIGVGQIANIGYPISDLADYSFKFEESPWLDRAVVSYAGEIRHWPRKEHGAWEIVHAALDAALSKLSTNVSKAHSPTPEDSPCRDEDGSNASG